ncbi:D-alanyl-lipoteichoic acid acyltransferase DltB, MBOAT superfamily [Catalinimonas alkaloidigena]|uniref:D-alanyl-lipoteichoic acid acyltransferase DltB, MBOAT superfamily n=1 Tax=Catalinimonas alkaloidigena TaxID=1075417 RepID=A0A1G9LFW3_9BACT|nr:MBOAT family O-acyltransferase [Catalinimonas alkaloidigena]SDL60820.1 D-alanyl-lipoteichoic acid acyltransferase DltB, MBOAT superfamily [Catalinimonas alkaloidigena]
MLFNSFQFLLFFPIVIAAYFAIPSKWRWALLLVASYYFYMCWRPEYIILILFSTVIDYWAGRQMGNRATQRERLPYLVISLIMNLGLLFSFKYLNFFGVFIWKALATVGWEPGPTPWHWDILLPVGISFYTFQTMSYSIDVYKGVTSPERHFGRFALFVSFFPQLVAGPIERSSHLLPQFRQHMTFDYDRIAAGFRRMAWGFFKKVAIADKLAIIVNEVYNHTERYDGDPASLLIATFFFAFQIYCDFSGYSDIAIGAAQIMGFDLMENFRQPYFSKSVSEFWKRWHISLSTWFRDYVYIPLGGNRVVKWRWYYNLFITFLVSGLWHGANYTFVIWGALHGFYLVSALVLNDLRQKMHVSIPLSQSSVLLQKDSWPWKTLHVVLTFVLVIFAWIFFRANTLTDAQFVLRNLLRWPTAAWQWQNWHLWEYVLTSKVVVGFGLILVLMGVEFLQGQGWLTAQWPRRVPRLVRYPAYAAFVAMIFLLGEFEAQSFIYFQF